MPYVLAPLVKIGTPGLWAEGDAYLQRDLFRITDGKFPPVNYQEHTLKSHSVTHAESELHVIEGGRSVDEYFSKSSFFFGRCLVLKLKGNNYKPIGNDIYLWEIAVLEIQEELKKIEGSSNIQKIIISTEFYPVDAFGYHDSNYVLVLSQEAAEYLVSFPNFNLYGTSWKSSDFKPGSFERPVHKKLLEKAIIFELLDMKNVPAGEYFFVGFPLRLENASESPVTPVLFEYDELMK